MAKDTPFEKERRDPTSSDRRQGDKETAEEMFEDYGFEEERAPDNRRDSED